MRDVFKQWFLRKWWRVSDRFLYSEWTPTLLKGVGNLGLVIYLLVASRKFAGANDFHALKDATGNLIFGLLLIIYTRD